jgi:hypothetical protein
MVFKILSFTDSEWNSILDSFPAHLKDVYYLPEWYQSWSEHEDAEAMCIYYEEQGIRFLYPFFKKKIKNYDLNDDFYDIQSAYGYGGVIANKEVIPEKISKQFNDTVSVWLKDNRVIAEFIRENPLINNVKREADYSCVRKNVYIETLSNYRIPDKQARQNIAKAQSSNLAISYDSKLDYLDEFIKLYKLTQERLNMHPYYDFNQAYFSNFKELLASYSTLIHIITNGQIIASGLYITYHEKAHLHLAASRVEYQILRANDLLYYGAIQLAMETNVKLLNVGGGTTNDPDDSLFKFKRKFSHNVKQVRIGKIIHNKEIYDKLTRDWEASHPALLNKYNNYFLKYHQEA